MSERPRQPQKHNSWNKFIQKLIFAKTLGLNFHSNNRQPSKALKFNHQPSKSEKVNRQPSKLPHQWDPLKRPLLRKGLRILVKSSRTEYTFKDYNKRHMNSFYHFSTMTVSYRFQSGMFSLFETKLNLFKPEQVQKSHESRPDSWLHLSILNMIGDLYQSRKQKKNYTTGKIR